MTCGVADRRDQERKRRQARRADRWDSRDRKLERPLCYVGRPQNG